MSAPSHQYARRPANAGTAETATTLLQRKCACGSAASGLTGECAECEREKALGLQAKLTLGSHDDPLEREADRIADTVLKGPDAAVPAGVTSAAGAVARATAGERVVGRPQRHDVPPIVHDTLREPGEPLEPATRGFMERRFGHDFGRVRVHAGPRAAESARAVSARAYTVGSDLVFAADQYRPHSVDGKRLLAHELTHTLQQSHAQQVQRDAPPGGGTTPTTPSVTAWSVRNSGATQRDNCCAVCPVDLGVDIQSPNYKNGIELKATLRNHSSGFSYDIKRTKEANYWRRNGASDPWGSIASWNKPAGSDDDSHDSDECLAPVADGSNHKIYAEDRPGFRPANLSNSYTDYVQMINFIEFVRVIGSGGTSTDDTLVQNWHTKMWVNKDASDHWSVNTAGSEIGSGHLASLSP